MRRGVQSLKTGTWHLLFGSTASGFETRSGKATAEHEHLMWALQKEEFHKKARP